MPDKKHKKNAGFTLLELLIVMVIIGLLVALVAPRFTGKIGESKIKTTQTQIEYLSSALESYYLDTGQYPSTEQGLKALIEAPQGIKEKWDGPYLKKIKLPEDGWGYEFVYKGPNDADTKKLGLDYIIKSLGKDNEPGGQDENQDLYSYK